jgi:hypothetical protein
MQQLLAKCGFEMVEFQDYTFPVFWALRRAYTRLMPVKAPEHETPEENTASSGFDAAGSGALFRLAAALPIWSAAFAVQKMFRHSGRGFEAMLLARAI